MQSAHPQKDKSSIPLCCQEINPINFALQLVSPKWTVEILRILYPNNEARTSKFLKDIPGLSMKSLRERLKELERHGLISRAVLCQRPLKVSYSLTPIGREFCQCFWQLRQFGLKFIQSSCDCPFDNCSSDLCKPNHEMLQETGSGSSD